MQVSLFDIEPKRIVTISGDEKWVQSLFNEYAEEYGLKTPIDINGQFTLTKDAAGFVYVKGTLRFPGHMRCPHCGAPSAVTITEPVQAVWRPPFQTNAPKDVQLTSEDLETYFIENNEIDLVQLVRDTFYCSVPELDKVPDPKPANISECATCKCDRFKADLSAELNHGTSTQITENKVVSPFSLLESLIKKT